MIEVELADAWVWDMYRKTRFVPKVRVLTFKDVNVEELPRSSSDRCDRPRSAIAGGAGRGRFGEDEAARWYGRHGYEVLARNWRCAAGELDLVLGRPALVVFCEVKARASSEFGRPEGAVNWAKQRRLRRWRRSGWPQADPTVSTVRFDVAAVVGARVEVIEAAF